MIDLIKKFDRLRRPFPGFTHDGNTELRTVIGSVISILIYIITLIFALQKLQQLLMKHNPQIVIIEDEIDLQHRYSTSSQEFMMAVAAETYDKEIGKSDPRYLRWVVSLWIKDANGNFIEEEIPMHKCTEEEFSRFYPAEGYTATKAAKLQQDGHLFCLDWRAIAHSLYGSWQTGDEYGALSIQLMPCTSPLITKDGTKFGSADENNDCEWDFEEY